MYVLKQRVSLPALMINPARLYSATHAPKLYKSLLLVDPVVASPVTSRDAAISVMTKGAVSRRDEWSSR